MDTTLSDTRISLHIGINGYAPAIGPLRFCVADATEVRNYLDAHREGFHSPFSILLADGPVKDALPPTRANIIAKIKQVCEQATDQYTLLIQFSGHGTLDAEGRLYLLPLDSIGNDVAEMGISWRWLIDRVEECRSSKKIVIIDACHSGAGKDVQIPSKMTAAIMAEVDRSSGGYVCLTSCSSGEIAYELPELGHGIFSYYLLGGISGGADPLRRGIVDIASLYNGFC